MLINGIEYTRREILRRVGRLEQVAGTRHYELNEGASKGLRAVDFDSGCGLRFTVLPDRGMDISLASYRGVNLVYHSPQGELNPAFYDGRESGWLRTFFAGLLTTCGLTHFGGPCLDKGEELGLHGRHNAIPARSVNDLSRWEGDEFVLELSGVVEDAVLFGDKIRLTRRITAVAGDRSLCITDEVENFGSKVSPFNILYHINPGFPLLNEDSRLVAPAQKVEPYDDISLSHIREHKRFSRPVRGFEEENYLFHMAAGKDGMALAALVNDRIEIGLYLAWDAKELPYLSEWKMMGEVDYLVGLEPCNAKIESRSQLRSRGALPKLRPGEKKTITLRIGVLDGLAEIRNFEAEAKKTLGKKKNNSSPPRRRERREITKK